MTQKKQDYAERVKARNRLLLAEQKAKSEDSDSFLKGSTPQQPSKIQRV